MNTELEVSEIFSSISGEGPSIGTPAIFLRLSKCNFSCKWKVNNKIQTCDTLYAKEDGEILTINKVAQRILYARPGSTTPMLIISGGEPTLQYKGIIDLLSIIPRTQVGIETNGSLPTKSKQLNTAFIYEFNHYVVSPKPQTPIENIKFFSRHLNRVYFKFVYDGNSETWEFIRSTIMKMEVIKRNHIYLMSAGCTYEELHDLDLKTVELCKQYGFNFSPRLQSYLYGKKRGV
jgi:organic radical activating enzyme